MAPQEQSNTSLTLTGYEEVKVDDRMRVRVMDLNFTEFHISLFFFFFKSSVLIPPLIFWLLILYLIITARIIFWLTPYLALSLVALAPVI